MLRITVLASLERQTSLTVVGRLVLLAGRLARDCALFTDMLFTLPPKGGTLFSRDLNPSYPPYVPPFDKREDIRLSLMLSEFHPLLLTKGGAKGSCPPDGGQALPGSHFEEKRPPGGGLPIDPGNKGQSDFNAERAFA